MITKLKLIELVNDNIKEKQVEGFICVGRGINFKVYGVEVPFSLTDLLGVDYKDIYSPALPDYGDDKLIQGFFGAQKDTLYYITLDRYNLLMDTLTI